MKTWADFLDDVMPEVPGAETNLVEDRIKKAAIEFMDRTRVYQADHPALDSVAYQGAYDWNTGDTETEVCHVFNVWYEGEKLTPKNGDYLADKYDYWPEEEGTPNHYLLERTDTLTIVPMPIEAVVGAIAAKVALRPTLDATGIPDDLFADHHEAIAAGALFRLLRMQKKPWTNVDLAAAYGQAFTSAVDAARLQQQKGNVRSPHHIPNPRSRFV